MLLKCSKKCWHNVQKPSCNPQHLLWLGMLGFPLMLRVKLSVSRIQPQGNHFATYVENEATGISKLKGQMRQSLDIFPQPF